MNDELLWQSILVLAVTFAGGLLTLFRHWSHETLHHFLAVGAGVFLGAVFLHLLPELFLHGEPHLTGGALLAGFLLMLLIERFLTGNDQEGYAHTHKVLSISALIGLSIHAVFDGLALASAPIDSELQSAVLLAVMAHKVAEAFAIGSLLCLSGMPRGRSMALMLLFSAMTPIGALVIAPMVPSGEAGGVVMPMTALATGTFLYIATGELLPEVFHTRSGRSLNLVLMLAAAIAIAVLTLVGHPPHAH